MKRVLKRNLGYRVYLKVNNPYVERTNWDWAIDPQGLRIALRRLASRYQVPILITENGLGEYDTLTEDKQIHDTYRIDYLRSHIQAIQEAITDGVSVIGYVHGVTPIYCRGSTAIKSVMVLSMWIKMKHKKVP